MNTDGRDEPCELENIVVGDGLDEFAQENGEPDTSAPVFEIVEAPITFVPAAPPRRAPARLRVVRAAARGLAAEAALSFRQSTASVRDYVRRRRTAAGAAVARGGATIASARQRSANALLTGASNVSMHVSDLAKSVQRHTLSTAQVTAAVCREAAALVRASSDRTRLAIAAAAITVRRRARFDFSSLVPAPRSAVGAVAVASLVGVGLLLWRQPAGSPVAEVPTSATVPDSQPAESSLAARTPALPATVPTPAPPAAAPPGTGLRPATPTVAQVAAAPEPETVYGGTVAVRAEPARQPPVVRAIAAAAPPAAKPRPEAVTPAAVVVPASIPPAGGVSVLAVAEPALVELPSRPALDTVDADRSAIEGVLSSYRRSYNSLDAKAVSAIWQGLDTRALARAFSTLTRQQMIFERCNVRVVAADRGAARCDGILSYVQKAGDTTPQQRRVSWEIDLRRPAADWVIVGVQAR